MALFLFYPSLKLPLHRPLRIGTEIQKMRAWVLDGPGSSSSFYMKEIPIPDVQDGWVLIKVKAFGLNRSEHHTLIGGYSDGICTALDDADIGRSCRGCHVSQGAWY